MIVFVFVIVFVPVIVLVQEIIATSAEQEEQLGKVREHLVEDQSCR